MEYEDLKLPFFHNNIDIESIAEKCGYHMKEVVAGNIKKDETRPDYPLLNSFNHLENGV